MRPKLGIESRSSGAKLSAFLLGLHLSLCTHTFLFLAQKRHIHSEFRVLKTYSNTPPPPVNNTSLQQVYYPKQIEMACKAAIKPEPRLVIGVFFWFLSERKTTDHNEEVPRSISSRKGERKARNDDEGDSC